VNNPRIIVSLDFDREQAALDLAGLLDPTRCRVKVGKELFTCCGPGVVEKLRNGGFDVFLDLKFHDIPHTVARACVAAAKLGVWMLNVHASGGSAMLRAAREAVDAAAGKPLLIAVTVLTSLSEQDLHDIGVSCTPDEQVLRLSALARDAGLDGVVCSAREAVQLRRSCGEDFALVTPGIRPAGSGSEDQKRIMTPAEAIHAGSDYLVIGRPVTRAADPLQALIAIEDEVRRALQEKP
jgi:orotidine-5'-phosphate decarboxylase